MDYEAFAADVNSGPAVRFHSADETEETLKALGISNYALRQMGRGSFRTDLAAILNSEGLALSHRFERSFYIPLHSPDGMVSLIMATAAGGDIYASGDVVSDGKLIVQSPETEVDLIAPDLTRAEAFGVPESRFYSMLETICPDARPAFRPGEMAAVAGEPARLRRLRNATLSLVTDPDSDPGHERQSNLIAEIIDWMGDSSSQRRRQGFPVNGTRMRIARRARDYMEDHFPEPIRLEDVCRETRVSLRTLHRAFVEYFQITPYDYLKKLRLDRARRALRAGEPATDSVTGVALAHGFTHLSRFSRDYREAFCESPRETLARSG